MGSSENGGQRRTIASRTARRVGVCLADLETLPLGPGPQLAFLVLRGLILGGDANVEGGSHQPASSSGKTGSVFMRLVPVVGATRLKAKGQGAVCGVVQSAPRNKPETAVARDQAAWPQVSKGRTKG